MSSNEQAEDGEEDKSIGSDFDASCSDIESQSSENELDTAKAA